MKSPACKPAFCAIPPSSTSIQSWVLGLVSDGTKLDNLLSGSTLWEDH